MTHRPPHLMGEGVLVFVREGGRGGEGEFELNVIREQAGVGPTCFVLVLMLSPSYIFHSVIFTCTIKF